MEDGVSVLVWPLDASLAFSACFARGTHLLPAGWDSRANARPVLWRAVAGGRDEAEGRRGPFLARGKLRCATRTLPQAVACLAHAHKSREVDENVARVSAAEGVAASRASRTGLGRSRGVHPPVVLSAG